MELNKWIYTKKKANGLYFYKFHNEFKKDDPINLSPIGARNQRKFAPNPIQFGLGFQLAHQQVF